MFCHVIVEEKFPVWAYGAIGGGVLLLVLIASVIAFCRSRKQNRPSGMCSRHHVLMSGLVVVSRFICSTESVCYYLVQPLDNITI